MTIQAVQISNTFNEFRETTNLVIDEVNKLGDGTGNLVIDTITANTFVGVSSDLNIVGDTGNDVVSLTTDSLVFSGTNGISTNIASGSNTVVVNLTTTGVSSGVYGSANQIPVFNVNSQGRITSASNVSISTTMTVAGNTGNDVISFATETLRIVGTNGISTSVASGSNTVTINLDSTSTKIAANTLVHIFTNPGLYASNTGDSLGISVGITDSYVILAAEGEDIYPETGSVTTSTIGLGALYVYDLESKNLVRVIRPIDIAQSDDIKWFACRKDYLLIPASQYNGVYVYQISSGKFLHTLKNPTVFDLDPNDQFGSGMIGDGAPVKIHNDYCIVSSYNDNFGFGSASVFNYKTGHHIWSVTNPNIANNVTTLDYFGASVDIYDDTIIVGASYENGSNPGTPNAGAAYVFNINTRSLVYTITNPDTSANSQYNEFGRSVAIGKTYFAVATRFATFGGYIGAVYVYRKSDGALIKTLKGLDFSVQNFGTGIRFYEDDLFISSRNLVVQHNIESDTSYRLAINSYVASELFIDINNSYVIVGDFSQPTGGTRFGAAYLHTWKDVKTTKLQLLDEVQKIDFAFGKSIDKTSPLFNLPTIESKYTPAELVHIIATPENIVANEFGKRTAITNKYFIASSDSVSNTGNVHVYDLKSGSLRYFLTNPNPVGTTVNDFFGSSLAADDTYLAVGSFEDDVANTDSGKVYVYQIDTGGLLYTLNNPTANGTSANDFFGTSGLALANNYIIVGAQGEANTIYSNTGIVYVYSIPTFSSSTINTATRIIYNPEHANNDYFGSSIATDGKFAVIGAYNKTIGANTGAGKAYIFDISNNSVIVNKLVAPTSNVNDFFGYSVSMDANWTVVGAYNKNIGANTASGAVYVYRTNRFADGTSNNIVLHVLTNPNQNYEEANDQFGFNVSINNGKLAVSSIREYHLAQANSGIIYLYDIDSSYANLVNVIYNPTNVSSEDQFGYYIASNRNYIVTTARSEDSGNTDAGRVYVYATRPVRDMQIPELSQVERITLADGTQITSTTAVTTSNINKYSAGSYLYLSSNFGGF